MDCRAADSLIVNSGLINPFKILPQHNFSFQPSETFPVFQDLVKIGFSIQIDMWKTAHKTLFLFLFFCFSFFFFPWKRYQHYCHYYYYGPKFVLCLAWRHIRRDDIRSPWFLRRNHFSGSLPHLLASGVKSRWCHTSAFAALPAAICAKRSQLLLRLPMKSKDT